MEAPSTPRQSPDAPALPVEVGQVVGGKYSVERILARGGAGVVVRAKHLQLLEPCAIKFMLPEALLTPMARERFLREARACARLRSDHIVKVFDVGELDAETPYMVLEYLEGIDLEERLARGKPIPVAEAIDYVLQICAGLAEAHSIGIVHRDLKPANVFLTRLPDGTTRLKVLDFGISKDLYDTPGGRAVGPRTASSSGRRSSWRRSRCAPIPSTSAPTSGRWASSSTTRSPAPTRSGASGPPRRWRTSSTACPSRPRSASPRSRRRSTGSSSSAWRKSRPAARRAPPSWRRCSSPFAGEAGPAAPAGAVRRRSRRSPTPRLRPPRSRRASAPPLALARGDRRPRRGRRRRRSRWRSSGAPWKVPLPCSPPPARRARAAATALRAETAPATGSRLRRRAVATATPQGSASTSRRRPRAAAPSPPRRAVRPSSGSAVARLRSRLPPLIDRRYARPTSMKPPLSPRSRCWRSSWRWARLVAARAQGAGDQRGARAGPLRLRGGAHQGGQVRRGLPQARREPAPRSGDGHPVLPRDLLPEHRPPDEGLVALPRGRERRQGRRQRGAREHRPRPRRRARAPAPPPPGRRRRRHQGAPRARGRARRRGAQAGGLELADPRRPRRPRGARARRTGKAPWEGDGHRPRARAEGRRDRSPRSATRPGTPGAGPRLSARRRPSPRAGARPATPPRGLGGQRIARHRHGRRRARRPRRRRRARR